MRKRERWLLALISANALAVVIAQIWIAIHNR